MSETELASDYTVTIAQAWAEYQKNLRLCRPAHSDLDFQPPSFWNTKIDQDFELEEIDVTESYMLTKERLVFAFDGAYTLDEFLRLLGIEEETITVEDVIG